MMSWELNKERSEADAFSNENWASVMAAVDATYAELVDYQNRLEEQNTELLSFQGLLRSIFASVHDVMLLIDRDGNISDVSQSFADFIGESSDTLIGLSAAHAVCEKDRSRLVDTLATLRVSGAAQTIEVRFTGHAGDAPFDLTVSPRLDARRRVVGAVVLGRPLGELREAYRELAAGHEELKQTQSLLVRNEKLAGLGRLLAGVAHELNNPISFVYANAHALERYVGRFETYFEAVESGAPREKLVAMREELRLDRALRNLRTAIDGAKDGSERVRDIVDDLRRLSSDGTGETETFDLVEVSKVAARWVERGSKSGITPEFEGADSLVIEGNPGHVQQVVMNLVQNAMDAARDTERPRVRLFVDVEGLYAALTISDNGPGVDEETAAKIFDPFFTTKAVGDGTGLGLAICLKIAEEHGGTLLLVPSEIGATFKLLLPLKGTS